MQQLIETVLLSNKCSLTKLNLSRQILDESNVDSLALYVRSSSKLHDLSLAHSKLGDIFGSKLLLAWLWTSIPRGSLSLSGNLLGPALFSLALEELEDCRQLSSLGASPEELSLPLTCGSLDLSHNLLTDQALGVSMPALFARRRLTLQGTLDLSHNPLLGRPSMAFLRQILEEERPSITGLIDLSENSMSIRKAASILEMRSNQNSRVHVIYSREEEKGNKEGKKKKKFKE